MNFGYIELWLTCLKLMVICYSSPLTALLFQN